MPPRLDGIHHLKLPTADFGRSLAFFAEVFAAHRLPAADHLRPDGTVYAHVLHVPGLDALVELRLDTHGPDVPPDTDDPWVHQATTTPATTVSEEDHR